MGTPPSSRRSSEQNPAPEAPRPSRGAARDEAARAALAPLGPDERPRSLLIAIAVSLVLAVGVLVGALTVHDLSRHGGSLPGAVLIAIVLVALAQGMWQRRYWAVLGF